MIREAIEDSGDDGLPTGPALSFLSELEAGETVVWTGRPRSLRRLVMRTISKALFGLAFLAFILFWMAMVVRGGGNWDRGRAVTPFEPHNVMIATLAGLWMIPFGLYLLTWPLRTWRRLKGICYVLTNRQAIMIEPGLLGRRKVGNYTADSLRLMRLEEHNDGTGDLIFESRPNRFGMVQPVGFLAIEEAREVEALVRRTLFSWGLPRSESPVKEAPLDPATSERKTYRISLVVRLLQCVFLAAGLLTALCTIGNIVLFNGVLITQPKLLFSLIARMNPPGAGGAGGAIVAGVGTVLAGALVAWNFFFFALVIPIEITIDKEGAVGFRSRLRTIAIPAGEITSISTGGWYDPNGFQAVVRHKGGKLKLINQFADFRDFLVTLRELNPAVEIKGF
ncbi:MAG: hypothetical protein NVSMB9_17210 [Isosphaeraceae bacterium]